MLRRCQSRPSKSCSTDARLLVGDEEDLSPKTTQAGRWPLKGQLGAEGEADIKPKEEISDGFISVQSSIVDQHDWPKLNHVTCPLLVHSPIEAPGLVVVCADVVVALRWCVREWLI